MRLRRGELKSAALTSAYLERIERFDGRIRAYVTVTADSALERARTADEAFERSGPTGPLHGLPVAVKDNIDTAGIRTTAGSLFFERRVPDRSATVVERLIQAGAVLLGKTALHEFAFGATTQNPHYGCCRNPWDLQRVPGGSSGGSGAALAGDLCAAALGTDTGGSVRIPAALNGSSALRPTPGCVSTFGMFPVSWTLDTVGPMARSVADVADLFSVLAGFDPADPGSVAGASQPLEAGDAPEGLRIGMPREFFFDEVDPDVLSAVRAGIEALSGMGARVEEIDLPGAANALEIASGIALAEALAVHRERLEHEPDGYGEDLRRRLGSGLAASAADYALHRQEGRIWARTVSELLKGVDLIITPVTPIVAPLADGADTIETTRQLTRFTYGWSLAGVPALALPCGFSADGMPIGMQLAAAPWREWTLLAVGRAFQEETDWHTQEPSLASSLSDDGSLVHLPTPI
jgi:aspartyl-tRNA(Asn)/glutamyl-tRNA(Gln) amidotransferase subunit A